MSPRWLLFVVAGCGFQLDLGVAGDDAPIADAPEGDGEVLDASPDAPMTQPPCAQLALGSDHSCALRDGSVYCWGQNGFGELGGTGWPTPVALPVPTVSLGSRAYTTCAAGNDGSVRCWGLNDNGQTGSNAVGGTRPTPVLVQGMDGAVQVIAGRGHACARRANGTVRCWGSNSSGQLGDGTMTSRATAVSDVLNLTGLAQISAGGSHTCAHAANGAAWCWGDNGYMQLGNNSTTDSPTPIPVPVTGVTQMGPASFSSVDQQFVGAHTCAITGGLVRCWGDNAFGQLGNGTAADSPTPVLAAGLPDAVQIAMGRWHVCALRAGGTVMCWGRNLNGEVGDGTLVQKTVPVNVGLTNIVHIGAGGQHACAINTAREMYCWGLNTTGQLGDGTLIQRTSPVRSLAICP